MRNKYLYILILSLLFCACDKSVSELELEQGPNEWVTAKVAVVLPLTGEGNDKVRYERISKLFEENVSKAQYNQSVGVKLELEWYDENTVNLSRLAHEIYYRDDIKAVIGPLSDDNIELVANVIDDAGIPMFVMSSCEDVVRRYSCGTAGVSVKKPFLWALSETDIVQAYLMLAKAESMGVKKVSVISVGNKYGDTFNKWVPYHANELKLDIVDRLQYANAQELGNEFTTICESEAEVVICALNDPADAKIVLEIAKSNPGSPKIFFTGSVLNSSLMTLGELTEGAEGFSMYSSPNSGFHLAYQAHFGETPMPVEAQLYDAFLLSLASFAYCHYSEKDVTMNEALARLSDLPVAGDESNMEEASWITSTPAWDHIGLRDVVLNPIRDGQLPKYNIVGTLGNLKFAAGSYTTLVKSTHINWLIYNGFPVALDFINEKGAKLSSNMAAWDWKIMFEEIVNGSNSQYKPYVPKGNKAVLICGSEGWTNYRHQADLLHVYHTLKKNNYSDDDIILIMRDDIAHHPKNPNKGIVRVAPDGENLYKHVVMDYRADTLSTQDIEDILVGNKGERLSTVLESTDTDNVLLYWTGHGTKKSFSWLETGEKFTYEQMGAAVRKLYEDRKYQSMLICAEPCYSGSVVKAIEGTPLVLGISAADDNESSFADNFSNELGVWMCDRFTSNLVRIVNKEHKYINLLDTYKQLYTATLGSHVQVYNLDNFYNLGDAMLWHYFIHH